MRISVRAIVLLEDKLLVMKRDKFGSNFMSLVGGAVENGETKEQALVREVREESSITVSNPRCVIVENAGEVYGLQYIYMCEYVSGEPKLDPESEEAKVAASGTNLYTPMWLPLPQLNESNLLPKELKELLVKHLAEGFPESPIELNIPADSQV